MGIGGQASDVLNAAVRELLGRSAICVRRHAGRHFSSVTFPLCTPIIITQFTNIVKSLILIKRYACARAAYKVTKQGRLTGRKTQAVQKQKALVFIVLIC